MFIDKNVWLVGDISQEELKIAKQGPRGKTYTADITIMVVFGALGVAGHIFKPEIGVLPLIILWVGCALMLGYFAAIDIRQDRKYSRLMNDRKTHRIEADDPLDRLRWELGGDRDFLNRHNNIVDSLFEIVDVWEAWEALCNTPSLSEDEKDRLNELINSDVRDIARMMRDLEVAPLSS